MGRVVAPLLLQVTEPVGDDRGTDRAVLSLGILRSPRLQLNDGVYYAFDAERVDFGSRHEEISLILLASEIETFRLDTVISEELKKLRFTRITVGAVTSSSVAARKVGGVVNHEASHPQVPKRIGPAHDPTIERIPEPDCALALLHS